MLKYQIYQSQLKGSTAYGKWYCRIVSTKTMNVAEVAEHMHAHHTPFSSGTITGIITDAVRCTKELLLEGKKVYWDNLASFGLSIEHNYGAATADEFTVAKNVKNVKLTAQGVGEFSKNILSGKATLREAKEYLSPKTGMSGGSSGGTEPQNTCKVELSATAGGSVEGAGSYTVGSRITIKAIANAGYHFVKWSDEDTNATRNITVSDNISLTATFEADNAGGGNAGGGNPGGGGGNPGGGGGMPDVE